MADDRPAPSAVRRRFRAIRTEAALTGTGTAVLLAGILLAAVGAYVAGLRGLIAPGAWAYGLAAGLPVLGLKVLGDLYERDDDAALWREALAAEFGPDMRLDPEVTRQARQAIEFRVRLAEAEAKAGSAARARIAPLVGRLDGWMDAIVRLAREVSTQRGEASFQSSLAARARSRQGEVQARAGAADDAELARQLAATAEGLGAQIASAEGFSRHAEGGLLQLEHAVAAFGAACSQLALELSRRDGSGADLATVMAAEMGRIERDIDRLGAPPPGAEPSSVPQSGNSRP
jgi:hypothetical protein